MFHVSLKLREPDGFVVPKGPDFSRARTIRSEIDGTEILFKAPRHQKFHGSQGNQEPDRHISSERLIFRKYYNEEDGLNGLEDHWRDADFFASSWAFNGPWFSGKVASVHLSFELKKIVNYPDTVSLFHPRALEQVIGDHLTYLYARRLDEFNGNIQEINAPVNWQRLTHLPVNAAKLDVVSQELLPYRLKRFVYFPIAENIMASLIFLTDRRYGNKTKAELDKIIDEKPLLELIDNIINSIQVKLSPEAQAQQEAALAGMEDTSLVDHYPILKWDTLNESDKLKVLSNQNG